jgi:peptide/nickel transport system substrate-binding protein
MKIVLRTCVVLAIALTSALLTGCGGGQAVGPTTSGGGSGTTGGSTSAAAPSTSIPKINYTVQTAAPAASTDKVTWDDPYGEPISLDPLQDWGTNENTVLPNVCESLTQLNPQLQVQPDLAQSYKQTGPNTWLFTLRPGIKFSDGHPMTDQDVVFSIARQLDPKNGSFYATFTSLISSVSAHGNNAVVITTKRPVALIPEIMALGIGTVVEKAYVESKGTKYGTAKGGVMCTGPFELQSWQPGQSITLVPNPNYWDAARKPKASKFVFDFVTSPSAVIAGLQNGSLDGAYQIPISGLQTLMGASTGKVYFGANLIDNQLIREGTTGPFADVRLRHALSLAIDRTGLGKSVWQGYAAPSQTADSAWVFLNSPQLSTYQSMLSRLPDVSHPDLAAAKKLVAAAGNPKTPTAVGALAGDDLSVGVATEVVAAGQSIGLPMSIKQLQPAQYVSSLFEPKERAGLSWLVGTGGATFQDFPDPLESEYENGITPASTALYGINDPALNHLVLKALATSNAVNRAKISSQAWTNFQGTYYLIGLDNSPEMMFMNNRITGAPAAFPAFMYEPWAAGVGATK